MIFTWHRTLIALQARIPPETQAKLIEYFLETESGEMQYETARMRPLLTDHFFDFLSQEISESLKAISDCLDIMTVPSTVVILDNDPKEHQSYKIIKDATFSACLASDFIGNKPIKALPQSEKTSF